MENLFAFCFTMSSMFYDNWSDDFDIVGMLPLEIAIMILRKLDPKSLLNAITVSKKWLRIVKSDRVLIKTVRGEMMRQRKSKLMRELFLSRCVASHFTMLSKPKKATEKPSGKPYPDKKKAERRFEKSIKTVDKVTKKARTWVSSVSTKTIRSFR